MKILKENKLYESDDIFECKTKGCECRFIPDPGETVISTLFELERCFCPRCGIAVFKNIHPFSSLEDLDK